MLKSKNMTLGGKKLQQVCLKKEEADPQKLNLRKLNKKKMNMLIAHQS